MKFILDQSIPVASVIFIVSTILIALSGIYLSKSADRLADITKLGEAMVGALFLGGITSLPGIVSSVTSAYEGHPHLSVSNAMGGIALQTVFLAIADLTYRPANLEHAAASLSNILQCILLIFILSVVLLINILPELALIGVHPASPGLILIYLIGQKMIAKSSEKPMWKAVETRETKFDTPEKENITKFKLKYVLMTFILCGAVIAFSGYCMVLSSIVIASETGLSETIVGGFFTALSSSTPELIVSIAAVRQGSLTLAVSNIIGGNTFDVLFLSFSDFAYREGSIYHTFETGQTYIIILTLILSSVLVLGLLYRQQEGFAKIGWESMTILLFFIGGYVLLFFI